MEMNFQIQFGLPSGKKVTHNITRKSKDDRFANQAVIVLEPLVEPVAGEEGKITKVVSKITVSSAAMLALGYFGKAFQSTEKQPNELVYYGSSKQPNGEMVIAIINTTNAPEAVQKLSSRMAKSGSFSNKDFHAALVEAYKLDATVENAFRVDTIPDGVQGLPAVIVTGRYYGPEEHGAVDGSSIPDDATADTSEEDVLVTQEMED